MESTRYGGTLGTYNSYALPPAPSSQPTQSYQNSTSSCSSVTSDYFQNQAITNSAAREYPNHDTRERGANVERSFDRSYFRRHEHGTSDGLSSRWDDKHKEVCLWRQRRDYSPARADDNYHRSYQRKDQVSYQTAYSSSSNDYNGNLRRDSDQRSSSRGWTRSADTTLNLSRRSQDSRSNHQFPSYNSGGDEPLFRRRSHDQGLGGTQVLNAKDLNQRLINSQRLEDLYRLCEDHGERFDHVNTATALHRLAKLKSGRGGGRAAEETRDRHSHVIGILTALMIRSAAAAFAPRELSNVMWALATLGIEPTTDLRETLFRRAGATAEGFIPQGVSNFMWALATLNIPPPPALCVSLSRQATRTAGDFRPQNVANLMWALAVLGIDPGTELCEAMAARAARAAGEFIPQDISNLMWALATLAIRPDPALLRALLPRAVETAGDFSPQAVANLMWALATLGIEPGAELVAAMGWRAVASADAFTAQHVGNLLWALTASVRVAGPARAAAGREGIEPHLFDAMCARAAAVVWDMGPQSVCNMLVGLAAAAAGGAGGRWACVGGPPPAQPQPPPAELAAALARKAASVAQDMRPQQLADTVGALAALGIEPGPELVGVAAARVAQAAAAGELRPRAAIEMQWGLAALGVEPSPDLVLALTARAAAAAAAGEIHGGDVVCALWAAATLGTEPDTSAVSPLLAAAAAEVSGMAAGESARLLWACAALGIEPGHAVVPAAADAAAAGAAELTAAEAVDAVWALAVYRIPPPAALATRVNEALAAVAAAAAAAEGSPSPADDSEWSDVKFGVSQAVRSGEAMVGQPAAAPRVGPGGISEPHLCRLWEALLCVELEGLGWPGLDSSLADRNTPLMRRLRKALESAEAGAAAAAAPRRQAVMGLLAALGVTASGCDSDEQLQDPRTGYILDIAVRLPSAAGGSTDSSGIKLENVADSEGGRVAVDITGAVYLLSDTAAAAAAAAAAARDCDHDASEAATLTSESHTGSLGDFEPAEASSAAAAGNALLRVGVVTGRLTARAGGAAGLRRRLLRAAGQRVVPLEWRHLTPTDSDLPVAAAAAAAGGSGTGRRDTAGADSESEQLRYVRRALGLPVS